MDLVSRSNLRFPGISAPLSSHTTSSVSVNSSSSPARFGYPFPFRRPPKLSLVINAKKKKSSDAQPVSAPRPNIVEELPDDEDEDEEDQVLLDDFEEELQMDDDDDDEDFYVEDETELYMGDGGGGGGVKLAGTWWDKEAFTIAESVCESFDGDLGIYAFKSLLNSTIQVRIERLTNRSGSPTMEDIEAFSTTYRARLDEAELAKSIPDNISLEVSSPGVERVIRIPQDLDRFQDRAMYVKYVTEEAETDGIFRLVSYDVDAEICIWGIADVRVNREKAGKGRPLNKKQREWRLETSFDSLRLVRLHSEC
ncbi:PREDICTED: uncharacterized protein LOC104813692 [Tarenaya hassleriana]|uniref:uncharacterized protein LOC104813692 n=1 Tax=Tarenaya hassleriana TaxID=28532 RepID=UPI00053C535E|nr:PREDICTED: uncharacterized protein LOC104813692 [Tarenaya hassleriana]